MQTPTPNQPNLSLVLEDLMGRKQVHLDQELIREKIQGKVVMVTGAAGSVGSELCRQVAAFEPLALVGFDQAETPLIQLQGEMERNFPAVKFHAEIGSITRPEDVERRLERYRPSIIYHAAAYKHVPVLERQVIAAIENNLLGTWRLGMAAALHGVESFVLISTDKAVGPVSVMGATKRGAELAMKALGGPASTSFVAVRFGNVLGSSGSVVQVFEEQIAAGGPVTVTDAAMRRYFMTAEEAGQLVLQAFVLGRDGEILVLDMGEPVRILDLARNLIRRSGLRPELDIKIEFTGVRPGEKLFEDLNLKAESLAATAHPRVRSLRAPGNLEAAEIETLLLEMESSIAKRDLPRLLETLVKLVPDYRPSSLVMEQLGSFPFSSL
jgi:FlaA1/EpsC-like NDP-sugar epimerase